MSSYNNSVATGYAKTVDLPTRIYCESWMFRKLWGNISGLRVLDAACGTGFVTRLLWEAGAGQIIGVDASGEMLNAFDKDLLKQKAVERVNADIVDYASEKQFDLITSAFLFNEANTGQALQKIVNSLSEQLKQGGLLCIEFDNAPQCAGKDWSTYSYVTYELLPIENHSLSYKLGIDQGGCLIEFVCHYHSPEVIRLALEAGGFKNVRFHIGEVSPEGLSEMPSGFWDTYIETPMTSFVTAQKN